MNFRIKSVFMGEAQMNFSSLLGGFPRVELLTQYKVVSGETRLDATIVKKITCTDLFWDIKKR